MGLGSSPQLQRRRSPWAWAPARLVLLIQTVNTLRPWPFPAVEATEEAFTRPWEINVCGRDCEGRTSHAEQPEVKIDCGRERRQVECAFCHPRLGIVEVVGTIMGNQAPGLIKGPHNGRQVLFQLLQAGRAQDDRIPAEALQGETARRHTHPLHPHPGQDLGSSVCVQSPGHV